MAAGGPIAAACGWWLWFNQHRFGAPFDFGYQAGIQRDFALANLPVGVLGQLVSPGRGVLFYAPWVLLALPGFAALRRRHRALAWTLAGAGALQLMFYALRSTWWGNWCWGPRYLVPVLPLVAMLAASAVAERRWRRWGWGLAGLGTVAAWSGLVVYNGLYQDLVFRRADGLRELLWSPRWSPLIGHWRELNAGTFDLLVGRLLEAAPAVGLAGLVIRGLPAILGLWLVWRELHRDRA